MSSSPISAAQLPISPAASLASMIDARAALWRRTASSSRRPIRDPGGGLESRLVHRIRHRDRDHGDGACSAVFDTSPGRLRLVLNTLRRKAAPRRGRAADASGGRSLHGFDYHALATAAAWYDL
jgi:hypothetical protein